MKHSNSRASRNKWTEYKVTFIDVERSCSMPSPRNTSESAARVINIAIDLVEQREERLRAIVESKRATPDEKFAALIELARLAGIVLHEKAEAEVTPD
jgi:ATP-dependent Zn protease